MKYYKNDLKQWKQYDKKFILTLWVVTIWTRLFCIRLGSSGELLEYNNELYIHVAVHRNKFLFNNQADAQIIQVYSIITINLNN